MNDLSVTDLRERLQRIEEITLPGNAHGPDEVTVPDDMHIPMSLGVSEAGTSVLDEANRLNFTGNGIGVTDAGDGTANVDFSDTDTHTSVSQDGTELVADTGDLNFTGSGVTVADDGDGTATATITDTDTDTRTDVSLDGTQVVADTSDINFTGTGVTVADDGDGTVTATIDDTDTNTHTGASDDGTQVYASVDDLNFGANLTVTDDGDTTVTVDATDTNTTASTHQFPLTQIADAGAESMRLFVPGGQTLTVERGGVQDDTGTVPAGLDLQVYDETNAVEAHLFTSKYGDPDPNPTIDGGTNGVDVTFNLRNATGGTVTAAAWLEYTIA